MANWKALASDLSMADGKIDDAEVKILKKSLFADGKIDDEEVQFLVELRDKALKKAKAKQTSINPRFEKLFFGALESNVLKDGKIDQTETAWLKKMIFADGKVDSHERAFLLKLKKAATTRAAEFDSFVDNLPAPKKAAPDKKAAAPDKKASSGKKAKKK
jgi:uncharacterized tellurite resistance protein B-like protein